MPRLRPDASVHAPPRPGGSMRSRRLYRHGWGATAALLLGACAGLPRSPAAAATPVRIAGHSYNRSDVDVYLTCGIREGKWLGLIPEQGTAAFEIAPEATRCASGESSFLAVSDGAGSYWARPVRFQGGDLVDLVIERSVGRSIARVHDRR